MTRPLRILAVLALCFAAQHAQAQEVLRIAAVVNDEVISALDLQARIRLLLFTSNQQRTPEAERRAAPQVLRGLIDERLQLQEAKARNVDVAEAEIKQLVEDLERANNIPRGGMEPLLQRAGVPMESLTQQLRARIAWQRTVQRRLRQSLNVGEEEIDEVLARLRENQGQPEYLLAEIFLSVDNPDSDGDVRQNAERLAAQARQVGDIRPLARQFSESASAASGGDLGWVQSSQLDPAMEAAVQTLQAGQVSAPVRTVTGYHVIQLRNRRTSAGGSPAEQRLQLRQVTLPLASDADLEAQTTVARSLSNGLKGCSDLDRAARDRGLPGAVDMGLVRVADLAPNVRTALSNLPVGAPSAPVRLETGLAIMMVCAVADAPGTGLPSRDDIRRRLVSERFDAQSRRYIRDLRQAAFIDIRL